MGLPTEDNFVVEDVRGTIDGSGYGIPQQKLIYGSVTMAIPKDKHSFKLVLEYGVNI